MKEMLGGCSVCCDDTGWAENPLVYCDGPNCNVAVHQACYGIRSVPKGEWFCRKCEAFKEKNIKVKCELCPSKDGALKPTENGQWAHVVCALYIPEVTFLDVTTMEPVKLSEIPRDRFNRTCYICEEKNNKGSKSSTYGACMSCNKAGCKLSFHVTCAQSIGLLCEEAGIYYDNVKYVGYCKHHYSKLKKSNNIKPIAPYRPQTNLENSSAECSPEKQATSTKPDIDLQASKQKKDLSEFNKKKLTIINNNNDKIINEKKIKELSFPNTPSNERNKSQPHIVSTHPSGNLIISIGAKPQTITSGTKNQRSNDLESGNPTKYQKMDNIMSTDKPKKNQNSEVLKIVEEPNLSRMENANTIIKSNVSGANKLHLSESNVRKNEASVINIPLNATMPKKELSEKKVFENNSSAPHMLGNSLNPSSSMALKMADTLSEEIETHKKYGGEKNLSAGQQQSSYKGPQLHRRFQKPSTSQLGTVSQSQGSASSWSSLPNGLNNSTHELEDLLERQWEQGGALLMEQAQHFDIASLLTCLYQLKSENVNLEDELATYTRRRDHLLAVNARLAIPLPPQSTGNRTPASTSSAPTSNHSEAFVHSRPNYQSNLHRIDTQLQHNYQNHTMSNRHQVHHSMANNIPSHVVIRGGVGQDPRLDNRRQSNSGQMNLNQMYQPNTPQLPSMGLPHHQLGMDGLPKHS